MIKIYTLPDCVHCDDAKKYFNSKNVEWEAVDMSKGGNKETINLKKKLKKLGFTEYPIIIWNAGTKDEMMFQGLDKDIMESLIEEEND